MDNYKFKNRNSNEYIVVNATALDKSGALSILKQFIDNIPKDKTRWLIFASDIISLSTDNPNIRIEPIIGVKPMHKRFIWDTWGLKKWLKTNSIHPIAAISLQNTGFRTGEDIPNFIYYHQPIPFYKNNWNLLKSQERTLWFYKTIYPFFVKLFLKKDTKVLVQLDFIKNGFIKRFKHPEDKIGVFMPKVIVPHSKNYIKENSEKLRLIYPATPFFYKNHRVIDLALKLVDIDLEVMFTTDKAPLNTEDNRITHIGVQPSDKIYEFYHTMDAMLFPSYIETFGLPLLEAAMTGLPIIAADLPYAREVLKGYDGVTFVKYDNPEEWARAIKNLESGKRYQPLNPSNRPGWKELFQYIKSNI